VKKPTSQLCRLVFCDKFMRNDQNNKLIAAGLIAFIVIGAYSAIVNVRRSGEVASAVTEKVKTVKATVSINYGDDQKILGGTTLRDVEIEEGKTALDLTSKAATIEKTGESKNAFVTSINGAKADSSKNEYWELIVNGKSSQVGAGSYVVKEGDKIEWRLSKF
jgi:hypothetical protein